MKPGEPVYSTGRPQLSPGIIGNVFDGIQRPLPVISSKDGAFISRGVNVNSLDREKNGILKLKFNLAIMCNRGK